MSHPSHAPKREGEQEHFVAHLKIERVTRRDAITPSGAKRDVDEVTQINLRAASVNDLVVKLQAHIALVGDLEPEGD